MGLYDHIRCRAPLPDDGPQDAVFQTKDTEEQYLGDYTIAADGLLIHHKTRLEVVPLEERPFPDGEGLAALYGSERRVPIGDEVIPHHGDIYMCTHHNGVFVEYCARFTEGKLARIWRVRP